MYSILGRGSFCFNYYLNSAWYGGDQFVALLRWYGSPGFFDSGLQLICIFGLLFLIFLLTIPHRFSMGFRSGEFAGQSSTTTPWSFNQLLVILSVWAVGLLKKTVLSVGCAYFSFHTTFCCASYFSTLFASTQLSVNMLGYSTL